MYPQKNIKKHARYTLVSLTRNSATAVIRVVKEDNKLKTFAVVAAAWRGFSDTYHVLTADACQDAMDARAANGGMVTPIVESLETKARAQISIGGDAEIVNTVADSSPGGWWFLVTIAKKANLSPTPELSMRQLDNNWKPILSAPVAGIPAEFSEEAEAFAAVYPTAMQTFQLVTTLTGVAMEIPDDGYKFESIEAIRQEAEEFKNRRHRVSLDAIKQKLSPEALAALSKTDWGALSALARRK